MTEADPSIPGDDLLQILFNLFWRLPVRKSEATSRYAKYMRVDHDSAGYAICCPQNHVGRLSCNTRQSQELIHGSGDLALKLFDDLGRGCDNALGFVSEKTA